MTCEAQQLCAASPTRQLQQFFSQSLQQDAAKRQGCLGYHAAGLTISY